MSSNQLKLAGGMHACFRLFVSAPFSKQKNILFRLSLLTNTHNQKSILFHNYWLYLFLICVICPLSKINISLRKNSLVDNKSVSIVITIQNTSVHQ